MPQESNNNRVRQLLNGMTLYKPERTTVSAQMFAHEDGRWMNIETVERLLVKVLPKDEGAVAGHVVDIDRNSNESIIDVALEPGTPIYLAAQPVAASAAGLGGLTDAKILEATVHIRPEDYAIKQRVADDFEGYDLAIARAVERLLATQSAKQGAQPEPMAWAHEDGRVISAQTMRNANKDGGATLSGVRGYTIPLYPPATQVQPDVRNAILQEAVDVVPGGSICDPQQVADAIRALMKSDSQSKGEGEKA